MLWFPESCNFFLKSLRTAALDWKYWKYFRTFFPPLISLTSISVSLDSTKFCSADSCHCSSLKARLKLNSVDEVFKNRSPKIQLWHVIKIFQNGENVYSVEVEAWGGGTAEKLGLEVAAAHLIPPLSCPSLCPPPNRLSHLCPVFQLSCVLKGPFAAPRSPLTQRGMSNVMGDGSHWSEGATG